MFRTRSEYIDYNKSYTEIRNDLHSAYRKKGANAGLRVEDGRGLFLLNKKSGFRRLFDSKSHVAQRDKNFRDACGRLKRAINEEYKDWFAGGHGLGDEIFRDPAFADINRLDLSHLELIDQKIQEKMDEIAGNDSERMYKASQHRQIFSDLELARQEEAGRGYLARLRAWWSGDNKVELFATRANNWRNLVVGQSLLRKCIIDDLKADNRGGDVDGFVSTALTEAGVSGKGLTLETYRKAIEILKGEGVDAANTRKLKAHIYLKQNLAVNAEQIRRRNAQMLFHFLNGRQEGALAEWMPQHIHQCDKLVAQIQDLHSHGALLEPAVREQCYTALRAIYKQARSNRSVMGDPRMSVEPELAKIAPILDEQLAAIHDLALSLCEPNSPEDQDRFYPFIDNLKPPDAEYQDLSTRALFTPLAYPKELYKSKHDPVGKAVNYEAGYNQVCEDLANDFMRFRKAGYPHLLTRLVRILKQASRENDDLLTRYRHHNALSNKKTIGNEVILLKQRRFIQSLKLQLVERWGGLALAEFGCGAKALEQYRQDSISPLGDNDQAHHQPGLYDVVDGNRTYGTTIFELIGDVVPPTITVAEEDENSDSALTSLQDESDDSDPPGYEDQVGVVRTINLGIDTTGKSNNAMLAPNVVTAPIPKADRARFQRQRSNNVTTPKFGRLTSVSENEVADNYDMPLLDIGQAGNSSHRSNHHRLSPHPSGLRQSSQISSAPSNSELSGMFSDGDLLLTGFTEVEDDNEVGEDITDDHGDATPDASESENRGGQSGAGDSLNSMGEIHFVNLADYKAGSSSTLSQDLDDEYPATLAALGAMQLHVDEDDQESDGVDGADPDRAGFSINEQPQLNENADVRDENDADNKSRKNSERSVSG